MRSYGVSAHFLFYFLFFMSDILGQYRIILSADTASEVRQMLSQKVPHIKVLVAGNCQNVFDFFQACHNIVQVHGVHNAHRQGHACAALVRRAGGK